MESIYLLIPLSLMLFVVGIWAIRYAVKSNQFEDLDNASQRIILDDRQERRQNLTQATQDTKEQPTPQHQQKDNP
ncbi:cbb3-type cytochrome oxidase assembly protein CcoS [Psychrobacter sp. I-STPA6b]|uniref:cbb3-type cytochrome oxidase assembly protein CcoS n=1 Tax=Psychrobacter sp. I-STPA6b TaxID=2585718 RepID=UPI001D0C6172